MKRKIFIVFLTSMIVIPLLSRSVNASVEKQTDEETLMKETSTSSTDLNSDTGIDSSEVSENSSQLESMESSSVLSESNKTANSEITEPSLGVTEHEDTSTQNSEDSQQAKESSVGKSSGILDITELDKMWYWGDQDNTNKNITLKGYKQTAPNDVIIPGAVKIGGEIYRVFVSFTSGKTAKEIEEPSNSIWKEKFDSNGKCSITSVTASAYNKMKAIAAGTMAYAFSQGTGTVATNLIETFPNLSRLDLQDLEVYNTTSTRAMVQNAPKLTYVNVSTWDVEKVTDMGCTFYLNSKLETIDGLNTWQPFNVKDLSYFFSLDWSLSADSIKPVEKWFDKDYPKELKIMDFMFWNDTQLTELNLSSEGWGKASKQLVSMYGTFGGTTNVKTINLNGWNLEKIQVLEDTFVNTTSLTKLLGLENSRMTELNNMKGAFGNSALEFIDLTYFNPQKSLILSDKAFYSNSLKKLLIVNGQIESPTSFLANYNFKTDNREKFDFPFLDANSGNFKDGTKKKEYIDGIVQRKFKIFPPESKGDLLSFKENNIPLRDGFSFRGWESSSLDPKLTNDQIEACVAGENIIDYNKDAIYFKAIWEPVKPATGPDNEVPDNSNNDLDIAYFPKNFDFSETKLSDNSSSQVIPIKRKDLQQTPQYNIGVRDYSEESKGWELTAQLQWTDKIIPGSSIMTSNDKGNVKINKNNQTSFDPNLIVPQPPSEKNPVKGVPNLEITTTASKVMEATSSLQNKTFDYDLGTVQLKILDPSIVTPGIYNGSVNWNLSVVPKP
ncbi:BspA family leucine-rich repeat surface protein [Enterococcus sp. DIV0800]|uniref:BspA family leucine-rich repeat surface protein n=1 Tax=unclassified Enterococcus TaxID=2608891 RepID=UPI003D2FDDBF